ncbi:MAG: S41 family peptidase [bacterium]|nr:S41 family peptidase [bacterium]
MTLFKKNAPATFLLATIAIASMGIASSVPLPTVTPASGTISRGEITADVAKTPAEVGRPVWSCRPGSAPLPEGFVPDEIYMASRPSLLPDGENFVFEWSDAIWIAPVEGGNARLLQKSSGSDTWPIVSPDGKRMAFLSNRSGAWHAYVSDIAEGAIAQQVGFHSESERPLAWSIDGKRLLCSVWRDNEGSVFDLDRLAWLPVDERGAEERLFDAPADAPSISPDGRYVLFMQEGEDLYRKGTTGENVSRIWCYDTQTESFWLMVKDATESRWPIWDADGEGFYYVSGRGGTGNIWYHAFPSGEEQQVTFFKGDGVIHPTLAKDEDIMIFRQGLYFYSIDPTEVPAEPKRIKLFSKESQAFIQHRQSVRRTYDSLTNSDEFGALDATSRGLEFAFTTGGDLYVMDSVLREPHLVYGDSRTHERDCVFSKDGQRLYFFSDRGDNVALLLAEKTNPKHFWWENSTFHVRPLIEDDVRRSLLSVSPDGRRMAWVESGSRLVIADTVASIIRRFPIVKNITAYDWSPDAEWLVATIEDDYSNADIWILPIDDVHAEPYNISRSFSWDGAPAWSPDGKIIAWVGNRPDTGRTFFYVWLTRQEEEALKAQEYRQAIERMGLSISDRAEAVSILSATALKTPDANRPDASLPTEPTKPKLPIDFEDLHERVHAVNIHDAGAPTFAPDSRRVLFPATINGRSGTYEIVLPHRLTPTFTSSTWGYPVGWFGDYGRERLIWRTSNRQIAAYEDVYPFRVYQQLDIADYQELVFLSIWGRLRDVFYDPNYHGADWDAIRLKYQAAARFAPTRSIFNRIIASLNGELNASHLGFYDSNESRKQWARPSGSRDLWQPITSHLGIIFDSSYEGEEGWLVESVIPGGPADSSQIAIQPGDLLVAIDGRPVKNGIDPTLLLNGPTLGKYVVTIRHKSGEERRVFIEAISYTTARELIIKAMYDKRRNYVHEKSGGAFGYINIAKMNNDEYYRFEREIFAEGFDKAGMIIDVRDNTGGFTADRVLNILGAQRHSWSVARYGKPAYLAEYWGRPVFDKPIVVLCNQNTVSNGEIFSHAIKQLGRGKLVGVQTNGGVIATMDIPLLDVGMLRHAHYGWYTLDGTDMELHGAIPDVIVENTPGDTVAGRDPQLDTAIDILRIDVEEAMKTKKDFVPNTYRWDHPN